MRFGKISLAALAAASLVSVPAMAQSLSPTAKAVGASKIKAKRIGASTKGENKAEGSTGIIIGVVAAAAVIGGIIILSDDDEPSSP